LNSAEDDRILVEEMFINTQRLTMIFSEAVDRLMPERTTELTDEETKSAEVILAQHRKANIDLDLAKSNGKVRAKLPPELTRN